MSPNLQETGNLVTFTEEILNGKLFFVVTSAFKKSNIPMKRTVMLRFHHMPFFQKKKFSKKDIFINMGGRKIFLNFIKEVTRTMMPPVDLFSKINKRLCLIIRDSIVPKVWQNQSLVVTSARI